MKTFVFYQKNSSAVMTLSAPDYDKAYKALEQEVKDVYGWRCDDEEGEGEDE